MNPMEQENTTLYGKAVGLGLGGLLPQLQPTPLGQLETGEPKAAAAITVDDIRKAAEIVRKYKDGKRLLEDRLKEDELWYRMRHWEAVRKKADPDSPEPSSAWLFNAIANKHADAMDNYPEPNVLPREAGDQEEAKKLSSILPCIMDAADFEDTYGDTWWGKLKHGTGAYFIGWDPEKENGLGDIDIHDLDLLNVYWEPGIKNIQQSRNLFIAGIADRDDMERQYPQFKGKLTAAAVDDFCYSYDPNVDRTDKVLIWDWYYKIKDASGRTLLHYCKFSGDCILYASENDPEYQARGYYDHGLYPVEFDVLYPEAGTPVGFGYIAICKNPQLYIDKLGANILERSLLGTKTRYMASSNAGINEAELKDANCAVVHSELAKLDSEHLQPINVPSLETNYINVLQMKIDEMKETSANRDFNNGGTSSSVTAAAAIAALQESGNKVSRDMIQSSYRSYKRVCSMVIELVRQFYTETRTFRILGDQGQTEFVDFNNSGIQDQPVALPGAGAMQTPQLFRRPVFDLKIKPQKRSPFTVEAQYERAKELYGLGFFNPENAQQSMIAMSMMEFEGKEQIMQQIQQGQTLYNVVQQLVQQVAALTGAQMGADGSAGQTGGEESSGGGGGQTISQARQDAVTANNKSYTDKIVERSRV